MIIFATRMTHKKYYTVFNKISSIFLILVLAWLTVSIPFVYAAQQKAELAQGADTGSGKNNVQDNKDPFANTTEEKTVSSTTVSEEYIHHMDLPVHPWIVIASQHLPHISPLYIAFHGELLSPPPEA